MVHGWTMLIRDFLAAVRAGDVAHGSVPTLATIDDALRNQEVIEAARIAESERRWVSLEELRE